MAIQQRAFTLTPAIVVSCGCFLQSTSPPQWWDPRGYTSSQAGTGWVQGCMRLCPELWSGHPLGVFSAPKYLLLSGTVFSILTTMRLDGCILFQWDLHFVDQILVYLVTMFWFTCIHRGYNLKGFTGQKKDPNETISILASNPLTRRSVETYRFSAWHNLKVHFWYLKKLF